MTLRPTPSFPSASSTSAAASMAPPPPPPPPHLSPLSDLLWRNSSTISSASHLSHPDGAWLAWQDLIVSVANSPRRSDSGGGGGGGGGAILRQLSGYAEPGLMTAIMGPSGCGKSTLLDALAGRLAKNATVEGRILLNGRRCPKLVYGAAGYVTQDDTLLGTLSVRETIHYSAHIRLPEGMRASEKETIVESTILEMGLQDCADTPVGNWHVRGLSGGERRRVSIALEILTRPRLLFLDEPTSGLDSASAFFVLQTLRSLSRDGRTVLFSIHQPSSEVFALFDNLCLLSAGRTIYFGSAAAAHEFFADAGFPCPPLRNPSDHFLKCVNSDFDRVKRATPSKSKTSNANADASERLSTAEIIARLTNAYTNSDYAVATASRIHEISQIKGALPHSAGSLASGWTQSKVLTKRSFVNMSRDVGYYWLRLVIYIIVAICVGSLYYNVGTSYTSILARGACTSFVSGFVTFMSVGGFPSFVEDMKVFHGERLNGHYGVLSFVVANTLSSIPFLFAIAIVTGTICYFMAGLHPGFNHYVFFIVNLFGCITVVESLMMAIASVVPNFLMGIITGAGILGMFMLVAGFFRLPNDLPKVVWRYPLSYMSFNYWALQGQYKNDLLGLTFKNVSPLLPDISGEQVLRENFQIESKWNMWWDNAMVFLNIFAYRLIFFINIKISETVIPQLRALYARRRASTPWLRRRSATKSVIPVAALSSSPPI